MIKIKKSIYFLLILLLTGSVIGCEGKSGTQTEIEDKKQEDSASKQEKEENKKHNFVITEVSDITAEDVREWRREAEQSEADAVLPDTILWFNATYAVLTYSNGQDWQLISGLEPTLANIDMNKQSLEQWWGITDRESALEAIENLKTKGHRGKCKEYMDEMKKKGLLDLDEDEFLDAVMETELEDEDNFFRYVIAHKMYQDGDDSDYLAAFDYCRINMLYADSYFCGYITYEEAMDGSLENSLILQDMFGSWEDMIASYLAGYQFWQNDPVLTDDSPTMERYQKCVELMESHDNPFDRLDFDMKLEKCW